MSTEGKTCSYWKRGEDGGFSSALMRESETDDTGRGEKKRERTKRQLTSLLINLITLLFNSGFPAKAWGVNGRNPVYLLLATCLANNPSL